LQMKTNRAAVTTLAAFWFAVAAQAASDLPALPDGKWSGRLTHRTVPDVDKDGEWKQDVVLSHCSGKTTIQFRRDDGQLEPEFPVTPVPFQRMFILVYLNAARPDLTGWVESQVWTLVDARPKGWTLGQSRAVMNQEKKPEDPWFTFRRFAWGNVEFDPQGCRQPAPESK
jgi:hypothetical protein